MALSSKQADRISFLHLLSAPYAAGSRLATYPHTQPFFAYAQYNDYTRPPGYLKLGYFRAKSAGYGAGHAAYGAGGAFNPAYYYSGSKSYFGPWYKPAPLALPPPYIPSRALATAYHGYHPPPPYPRHHASHQSYSPLLSASAYARRMGLAYPADLTASASSHDSFVATEVPDFSGHGGYVYFAYSICSISSLHHSLVNA